MDYSIYDAKRAGFSRVVFLIRREMREVFEEQVSRKYQGILEVDYAYQDKDDLPGDFAIQRGVKSPGALVMQSGRRGKRCKEFPLP